MNILKHFETLIDYLWESEVRHFEETYEVDTIVDEEGLQAYQSYKKICEANGWTDHILYTLCVLLEFTRGAKALISCGEKELFLIERSLELYTRVGLLQFDRLDLCDSLQHNIFKLEDRDSFDKAAASLKEVFGYGERGNPGIFNTSFVKDDCRESCHIYQQIRHERFKDRIASGAQKDIHYTVDEHPADICQIADIPVPSISISLNSEEK